MATITQMMKLLIRVKSLGQLPEMSNLITHLRNLQLAMLLCMQIFYLRDIQVLSRQLLDPLVKKSADFWTKCKLKVVFLHERPHLINT